MSTVQFKVSPWMILRPREFGILKDALKQVPRNVVTVFTPVVDWFLAIQPGDPVVICSDDTMEVFSHGTVLFIKKTLLRNILPEDLEESLIGLLHKQKGEKDPFTLESIRRGMGEIYGKEISLDEPVLVIGEEITPDRT